MFAKYSGRSLDARVQVRNIGKQWFPAQGASTGQVWEAAGRGERGRGGTVDLT